MYLGIDLGTSNSAIAGAEGGHVRLFKTADGTDVLPSAIYLDKRGHSFVGMRAYDKIALSPDNVAHRFKRLMGTSTPVSLAGGIERSPEELSAEILRTLVAQARTEAGDFEIEGAVVTIPAAFNQMQTEATVRAARAAGLDRVGLLQEPIAAALAAMSVAKSRDGIFLVYDLGGGTFDVALVQSVAGAVSILAHEGINMLGGTDFDRLLASAKIYPWLAQSFALPRDFQTDPRYRRLVGIALHAAEKAKIVLSTQESAIAFAGEEEIRMSDEAGADIFLSVDIGRRDLERLIGERIAESIELCRKVLRDNNYTPGDIDRIVLIGGPSKMPAVRARVPHELGIAADLQSDPMTAVAIGAAIFAESREWSEGATRRKSARASATVSGPIELRYDFPARTANDKARIKVKPAPGAAAGHRLQIDTPDGWTSGQVAIDGELSVEVPVPRRGDNHYRVLVFGPGGAPVKEAGAELLIFRAHASAAGIPATQTLAVKVVEAASGREVEELEPLVAKGTILPASGTKRFRAARELRGGRHDHIDIEFFQQAEGVPEPELNLKVGSFRLDAQTDLEVGDILRKGDDIAIRWEMDDNGLLKCSVEIPALGRIFETRNFYTPSAGHQNFDGEDGAALAEAVLDEAERDIGEISDTLGQRVAANVDRLRRRVDRQRDALGQSAEADTRRSVTEDARAIRQELSRLRHAPENRARVAEGELTDIQQRFQDHVRDEADRTSRELFDRLGATADRALRDGDIAAAERATREMQAIFYGLLWQQPAHLIGLFRHLAGQRFLAIDRALHERQVAEGEQAIARGDMEALRRVIGAILDNRFAMAETDKVMAGMVGLARA